MIADAELLSRYAADRADAAFAELVQRQVRAFENGIGTRQEFLDRLTARLSLS